MKYMTTAFCNDSLKLSFWDIIKLLCGRELSRPYSNLRVGLWKQPETDCPCEHCRRILGPLKVRRL